MPDSEMWKLIQRYVAGDCTPEQRQKIERWMNEDPANRQVVNDLEQIWELTPDEEFDVNVQEAWDKFNFREIRGGSSQNKTLTAVPKNRNRIKTVIRVAAAVLLVAFAGFFTWQYIRNQKPKAETSQFYTMQNLETQKGEKAKVTFSDGTEVILNAASSLQFPKAFRNPKREVFLNGEAYFKVAHDPDRPFIVHTKSTDVQVLGTKFNVRAWSEDKKVEVGVREGRVAVQPIATSDKQSQVLLTKGQLTTVDKGRIGKVQHVNSSSFLSWIGGGMYFNNDPFSLVLKHIERKFNVQISVQDTASLHVPYTATFEHADLPEILNIISASMGMEYRRKGSQIEFSANTPNSSTNKEPTLQK